MESINHFAHNNHPLKLINWEKIQLPGNIGITKDGFAYCFGGVFNACSNCCLLEFARKAEADAIKEEAATKLQHEGHPEHNLTLQLRYAAFLCDACKTEEKGLFYQCDCCDFWIHKTCASLSPTIDLPHHHPNHPLVLVYSLPEKFYRYPYYCKFCNKYIRRDDWLYHCGSCRYFTHIKCALNAQQQSSNPRDDAASEDVSSLLHFPMPEAFRDPLKLLHIKNLDLYDKETTEINHWSHPNHQLILNVEEFQGDSMMQNINSGDPIKVLQRTSNSVDVPPVKNHPEDFYCDICEEEMNPNFPLMNNNNYIDPENWGLGITLKWVQNSV
ncbi:hypothetical protein CTI12_AA377830 [Artemisia annua]|uniref:DC1 domain-containing protein n=1 Tax=Artemisia annua TaxID=35608 RepID=A0A2U1MI72_ARTAN|nr:hypothetical protein CTI12_AA377830 [Artemisia annua]